MKSSECSHGVTDGLDPSDVSLGDGLGESGTVNDDDVIETGGRDVERAKLDEGRGVRGEGGRIGSEDRGFFNNGRLECDLRILLKAKG